WLAARDVAASERAWRGMLGGFDEPTLVAGAAKPAAATVPDRVESYVPAALTAALRERARECGVTLNALMNAVMGLLLAAETGRTDVVFGSTVAGRPPEVEGLDRVVGMFLNTVPVRVRLRPDETVRALLRRMQDEYVDRMDHEYLGLGEIQRATGHDQLFDTLFVLQNFKNTDEMARLSARHGIVSEDSLDHTHYPLAVVVSPGERLHMKIDHRSDLIDAQRARGIHERFTALLERVAAGADLPVASIPALTPAQQRDFRAGLKDTAGPLPDETVAEMLGRRARRTPERTALVCGADRRSFAELDAAVNRLARALLRRGAGPETVVALGLPRSVDTVVALFAVLAAGAAYLPLELEQPDGRLRTLLDDARPALAVTTGAVADRLAGSLPREAIVLDAGHPDAAEIAAADPGPLTPAELGAFAPGTPGRLEHAAYLIYTSGSTGRPKGVVTPFRGLTNMHLNHKAAIFDPVVRAVHAADGPRRLRIAHTVSFAFDMSWEELLWLAEGHEVHVCDEDLRRDSPALVDYCDAHAVDVVNVTPTYATQLFEDGLLDGARPDGAPAHRPPLVLLGGEAVPASVWTRLRETDGAGESYPTLGYNLYGPTEYTINTLGGGTDESAAPTVGTPILRTRAYVLDPWLRPVPDGVPGELYIAGVG